MQAGKQVYNMYVCNAVMVVWGLLMQAHPKH